MAVYTQVSTDTAQQLLNQLGLGTISSLRGIQGGIENTNYFVDTDRGEYVLTVFERLTHAQLPFYLRLVKHLAAAGIPVPEPYADAAGNLVQTLQGKPAAVVAKLAGRSELAPQAAHCAQLGEVMARMHLAGQDFELQQPNLRGLTWWNETAPTIFGHLSPTQQSLLQSELAFQNQIAESVEYALLPRGPIHADLFRDNAMFHEGRLSGIFDFYFAGIDTWLFDLAVTLNDWCIDLQTGELDAVRVDSLLQAYRKVRELTAQEQALLPAMLRAAALRFWISRLWDFYLPREASLLQPHDPTHFERVLQARIARPLLLVG